MAGQQRKISKSDLVAVKWLWSVSKKERWQVFVLLITNTISALMAVLYADYSKNIINAASVDHSMEKVIRYSVSFLILIMFQLVLTLVTRSVKERCKARMEVTLRKYILDATLRKDYASVTKMHTGEIQNRMTSDVTTISDGFTTILPTIIYLIVKLCAAFIYLVVIDKIFALVFLIGGIFVTFFSQAFRKILKKLHKRVQETEGAVRSYIQEILTSLLVVKAFGVEKKVSDDAAELMETNYKAKMNRRLFGIVANAGISTTFNIGYVFALAFGAYRLVNQTFTFGTVTAMLQLVNQIQAPFASMSGILPMYFALLASTERIMEAGEIPEEITFNDSDVDPEPCYEMLKSIDFKDIEFGYDRDIILDNTSLTVNKGDFVAIMGISGIGKSTLLKLLLGVFNPNSGTINLNLGEHQIPIDCHTRPLFAYVPQGNFLMSGTIRENITFINDNVTEEEISEAIRISCSDQFVNELPEGLETVIGERGVGLSEGQLQRLAIARSILSKSPVMLLDEATSALDEATELRFLQNLRDMNGKTCIIVSHKKAALEICNKHLQIVDGKIVVEEK